MIYRRAAARLKAQDWLAITIELAIVIVGDDDHLALGKGLQNFLDRIRHACKVSRFVPGALPGFSGPR